MTSGSLSLRGSQAVLASAMVLLLATLSVRTATTQVADESVLTVEGYSYARRMEVDREGWVLAELPPEARRRMRGERDAIVVGPDGDRRAYRTVVASSSSGISGTLPSQPVSLTLPAGVVHEHEGQSAYLLSSPGPGSRMEGLRLRWHSTGSTFVRVAEPSHGRWSVLAEASSEPNATAIGEVDVVLEYRAGTSGLLLDLVSDSDEVPRLSSVEAIVAPTWLLFEAESAGEHLLAYAGEEPVADADVPPRVEIVLEETQILAPGPEMVLPLSDLPEQAVRPGASVQVDEYAARWTVNADAVQVGDLARLTLPAEAHSYTEPACGHCIPRDVRLVADGRQVPFVGDEIEEPTLLLWAPDLRPLPSEEAGKSTISIPLTGERLPLTQLELFSAAAPFRRAIRVRYRLPPTRPGVPQGPSAETVYSDEWSCLRPDHLRCCLSVPLKPNPNTDLEIVFNDGDNAPLPAVSARIWREARALKFSWPESPVMLLAGHEHPTAPVFDLQVLASDVRRRPAVEVTAEEIPDAALGDTKGPALLIAALVIAGAALVALLAKSFRG